MIYWQLFIGFLQVGCFAFGGAYGAIPLIRDVVLANGWLTEEKLTYMIAVSESTPGPIMVNLATYVGSSQGRAAWRHDLHTSGGAALVLCDPADHGAAENRTSAALDAGSPTRRKAMYGRHYTRYRHLHGMQPLRILRRASGTRYALFPNHAAPCLCYVRERFPVPEKALPHRAHCLIRRAWYYSLWHMILLLKGYIFQS